jgi:hypothetical protein
MQLEEAHAAAAEIDADARFAVVAIGRFELIDQLVKAPADAYPWGVSVVSRIDPTYRGVCRTRDELDEFVLLAPRPARARPAPRVLTNPATNLANPAKPAPAKPAPQALFLFE